MKSPRVHHLMLENIYNVKRPYWSWNIILQTCCVKLLTAVREMARGLVSWMCKHPEHVLITLYFTHHCFHFFSGLSAFSSSGLRNFIENDFLHINNFSRFKNIIILLIICGVIFRKRLMKLKHPTKNKAMCQNFNWRHLQVLILWWNRKPFEEAKYSKKICYIFFLEKSYKLGSILKALNY